jgi:hypothetical protein
MLKKNSSIFSTEGNGMAKLVMEIQSRQTDMELAEDPVIKQVENEDTPKVHVGHENSVKALYVSTINKCLK